MQNKVPICSNINNSFVRWVSLPSFYPKMFLGNFYFVQKPCAHNNFNYIINLCSNKLNNYGRPGSSIYNLVLSDDYQQPYEYFKKVMVQGIYVILEAEKRGATVQINCAAGINRSCSVIVAYAVLVKGWDIDTAIDYINQEKSKRFGNNWGTLTNDMFVDYLHRMKEEFH